MSLTRSIVVSVVGGSLAAVAAVAGAEVSALAGAVLPAAPVSVPVNPCSNTIDVIGVLGPAAGNLCQNK
jgi:hypothetical protein